MPSVGRKYEMETSWQLFCAKNGGGSHTIRMMHNLPTYCSASEMFTVNRVADGKAVIRNLVHRFMMRLTISKHLLVRSILSSDLVCSSRIRRHWARLLYVHYHGG